jgi:hypothetical protein
MGIKNSDLILFTRRSPALILSGSVIEIIMRSGSVFLMNVIMESVGMEGAALKTL